MWTWAGGGGLLAIREIVVLEVVLILVRLVLQVVIWMWGARSVVVI